MNYYEILGVSRDATTDEIKKSYRKMIAALHPDRVGEAGTAMAAQVNEAGSVLTNEAKRAEYDRELDRPQTPPPPAEDAFWGQEEEFDTFEEPTWGTEDELDVDIDETPVEKESRIPPPPPTAPEGERSPAAGTSKEKITPVERGGGFVAVGLLLTVVAVALQLGAYYLWFPASLRDWTFLLVGAAMFPLAGMRNYSHRQGVSLTMIAIGLGALGISWWLTLRNATFDPKLWALVGAEVVLLFTAVRLLATASRDFHGKKYPGIKIMSNEAASWWTTSQHGDATDDWLYSEFSHIPGVRAYRDVRISDTEVVGVLLVQHRQGAVISFTDIPAGKYRWNPDGSLMADHGGTLYPTGVSASSTYERGLARVAGGLKVHQFIVANNPGVQVFGASPKNVSVVPITDTQEIEDYLAPKKLPATVNRHKLAWLFQATTS